MLTDSGALSGRGIARHGAAHDLHYPVSLKARDLPSEGEVDIHAEPGLITVRPVESPRKGWAEAIEQHPPEGLIDEPTPTRFDDEEWEW
jgi:hypothetical protein